jgi:hypothetical protein
MNKSTNIEISELFTFFRSLGGVGKVQPVFYCQTDLLGGYRLVLLSDDGAYTVTEDSRPVRFGCVRDAHPILRNAYVEQCLAEEARVDLRECF